MVYFASLWRSFTFISFQKNRYDDNCWNDDNCRKGDVLRHHNNDDDDDDGGDDDDDEQQLFFVCDATKAKAILYVLKEKKR